MWRITLYYSSKAVINVSIKNNSPTSCCPASQPLFHVEVNRPSSQGHSLTILLITTLLFLLMSLNFHFCENVGIFSWTGEKDDRSGPI